MGGAGGRRMPEQRSAMDYDPVKYPFTIKLADREQLRSE